MRHDDLRAALEREPFLAFDLHTKAGRSYPVSHPENMAFSPRVEVVLLKHHVHKTAMIDIDCITEATYPAAKPPRKASSGTP
jgi:hypothetical protein